MRLTAGGPRPMGSSQCVGPAPSGRRAMRRSGLEMTPGGSCRGASYVAGSRSGSGDDPHPFAQDSSPHAPPAYPLRGLPTQDEGPKGRSERFASPGYTRKNDGCANATYRVLLPYRHLILKTGSSEGERITLPIEIARAIGTSDWTDCCGNAIT